MEGIGKEEHLLKKYLTQFSKIMTLQDFEHKPYLNTTQNQEYMRTLLQKDMKSAYTIMGGGDPIFQLLANDIFHITAADTNELQRFVFKLKQACFKTLSPTDYESFLLDIDNIYYLSPLVFHDVLEGFSKQDEIEAMLWQVIFSSKMAQEKRNLLLFRGGLEAVPIDSARASLKFIKKRGLYYKIRDNLEKANIKLIHQDAISYLQERPEQKYDYIDLTNILLFLFQLTTIEEFKSKIQDIRKIYENNLNQNGILVLDYLFGTNKKDLEEEKIFALKAQKKQFLIYKETFKQLQNEFQVSAFSVNAIPSVTPLEGNQDIIIYTKKKINT